MFVLHTFIVLVCSTYIMNVLFFLFGFIVLWQHSHLRPLTLVPLASLVVTSASTSRNLFIYSFFYTADALNLQFKHFELALMCSVGEDGCDYVQRSDLSWVIVSHSLPRLGSEIDARLPGSDSIVRVSEAALDEYVRHLMRTLVDFYMISAWVLIY